ncbi:MAG: protease inhibitor I42 family protein [Phycisphaerae bacterium]|nr:protease inhibitor I42 family protein [Phycisphaerae bacterium]
MKEIEKITSKAKIAVPLVISLESNPTTGYKWEIEYDRDSFVVDRVEFRQHLNAIGSGGYQEFTLVPQKSGKHLLFFRLRRPWQKKSREERVYEIEVS